jgi:uncharacterized protein
VFGLARLRRELPPAPPHDAPTPRQQQVLQELAQGSSTDQIASSLGIALLTVRNHIRDLLRNLAAHSRLGQIVRPFLPPRSPDTPPDPDFSQPGALRALASRAGLTPETEFDASWAFEYPDSETLGSAMLAVAGLATLAGPERERELEKAIVDGLASHRRADGSYRLSNEYHYLIARGLSLYAVVRTAGPGWTDGGIFDQPGANEHAAFMNGLADDGFILFGGPLAGTEHGRVRVLLVVNAESEAEIHTRLAHDPWVATGQLEMESTDPWRLLVGAERVPHAE